MSINSEVEIFLLPPALCHFPADTCLLVIITKGIDTRFSLKVIHFEYIYKVTSYIIRVTYSGVLLNIVKHFLIVWFHESKGNSSVQGCQEKMK